ncbi:MAG: hypothetical protein JSR21_19875 [Proteobacteria bacterium]|nr:hypothetical protein [Pseudomonadota bacterium]
MLRVSLLRSPLLLAAALGAACLPCWLPCPARAADATAAEAQALDSELRAWLAPLLGPAASAAELRIAPEGDHYIVSLPASWLEEPGQQATATLRPLDGGRWAVDDIRVPAQGHVSGKIRLPGGDPAGEAAPVRTAYAFAGQSAHAVIDPTLATPSTFFAAMRGVTADTAGDGIVRHDRLEAVSISARLQPATDGRLDASWTTDIDGMRYEIVPADGPRTTGATGHQTGTLRISDMDRSQAAALLGAVGALANAPTPDRDARLQAVVRAVLGLGARLSAEETAQDVRVGTPSATIAVGALHATLDGSTPDGDIAAHIVAGVDGLAVGGLSPGLDAIMPKHVDLGLSLTGLRAAAVEDLAVAALAPGTSPRTLAPQIDALFSASAPASAGPPTARIDALRLDLGPARLDGHGTLVAHSSQDLRGRARIALAGFDALAERLGADPDLAQGVILLALARSVARQEDGQMVWDIAFSPEALTINGVDPRKLLQSKP